MLLIVAGNVFGGDTAEIALVAAGVGCRHRCSTLHASCPARGRPTRYRFARHQREIQDDGQLVRTIGGLAEKGQHAVLAVGAVNPV